MIKKISYEGIQQLILYNTLQASYCNDIFNLLKSTKKYHVAIYHELP